MSVRVSIYFSSDRGLLLVYVKTLVEKLVTKKHIFSM